MAKMTELKKMELKLQKLMTPAQWKEWKAEQKYRQKYGESSAEKLRKTLDEDMRAKLHNLM